MAIYSGIGDGRGDGFGFGGQQSAYGPPFPPPPRRRIRRSVPMTTNNGPAFTMTPLGARYRIVTEGTGRVPTANDRVKAEWDVWRDRSDGQDKAYDFRGLVCPVSRLNEWRREAVLSMREGEVRQIIEPDGFFGRYVELRLVSIE
ncbi:unnamed protein product [Vitrella brassicaformis CCMP3155]|uniref:Uncharacterized protein n=1 Tax=Vitrella brassicaformis (strain CCMP3155) TaxID=1169540 RepID=A0A0G4F2I6_VITBC|nr:unnamed protein product [Vitrella brassicaformis CCMP3155]|eukprot:CEM05759.1 unnamed protein product [Vitrella brassicaformis CCMP3155]